jgi:hypothetical protein
MTTRLVRGSVSVWLPTPAHAALAATAATEGVSLPALARRAATAAAQAPGRRIAMSAPTVNAVAGLGAAGDDLNRLLPAADTAASVAQRTSAAQRIAAVCDRIAAAARSVRLDPTPDHGTVSGDRGEPAPRWKLVRVTADTVSVQMWKQAAAGAEFGSVANWIRDALAGTHRLDLPRPPAPATIEARTVTGRTLGLIAQAETTVSDWPASSMLDEPITTAADALYTALHRLVTHGGNPSARR